jgi:hypothetical protein
MSPLLGPEVVVKLSWPAFKEVMQLPTLETASFYGKVIGEPEPNSVPGTIRASKLKHCRFGGFGLDLIEFVLPNLQAPKLETITMRQVMSDNFTTHPSLEDVKFPSLRALYLLQSHAKPEGWVRLVDLTRNAKHLVIEPHFLDLPALQPTPDAFAWTSRNPNKVWSELESVSYSTQVDIVAAGQWPEKTTVRLPEGACYRHRANSRVIPICASGDEVLVPEFWPPDFRWGDNTDDPFLVDM